MRKYDENPKNFPGLRLCPGSAGGLTAPPHPPPKAPADYSDRCAIVFSK